MLRLREADRVPQVLGAQREARCSLHAEPPQDGEQGAQLSLWPRSPLSHTGPVTWEGRTGVQKATGPWKSHTLSYFYLVYFFLD